MISGCLNLSFAKKAPGINFNEKTATLCYDYAVILEENGNTNAAVEVYQELLKMHPGYIECYVRLSKVCVSMGKVRDGLKWLEDALKITPDNPDVLTATADLYFSQVENGKALQILNGLCRKKDVRAHLVMGNIRRCGMTVSSMNDQLKESYKFYFHVLEGDRRNSYAANGLGIVLAEKKKLEAARDTFSRVRESNSPGSDIFFSSCFNLAIVNMALKKYVDAIQLFQTCLRSLGNIGNPSEPSSLSGQIYVGNCLAMVHLGNENFKESMRALSRMVFLNPTVLHSWYNLAFVREECAVNSLRKKPKSSGTENAIAELKVSRSVFRDLDVLSTIYNASKHISSHCSLLPLSETTPRSGAFARTFSTALDSLRNVACGLLPFDKKTVYSHESYCEVCNVLLNCLYLRSYIFDTTLAYRLRLRRR